MPPVGFPPALVFCAPQGREARQLRAASRGQEEHCSFRLHSHSLARSRQQNLFTVLQCNTRCRHGNSVKETAVTINNLGWVWQTFLCWQHWAALWSAQYCYHKNVCHTHPSEAPWWETIPLLETTSGNKLVLHVSMSVTDNDQGNTALVSIWQCVQVLYPHDSVCRTCIHMTVCAGLISTWQYMQVLYPHDSVCRWEDMAAHAISSPAHWVNLMV